MPSLQSRVISGAIAAAVVGVSALVSTSALGHHSASAQVSPLAPLPTRPIFAAGVPALCYQVTAPHSVLPSGFRLVNDSFSLYHPAPELDLRPSPEVNSLADLKVHSYKRPVLLVHTGDTNASQANEFLAEVDNVVGLGIEETRGQGLNVTRATFLPGKPTTSQQLGFKKKSSVILVCGDHEIRRYDADSGQSFGDWWSDLKATWPYAH